jgi:hypothetical protein
MEVTQEISRWSLIDRAKNILFQPRAEWRTIAAETATAQSLYRRYVLVLAAIGPICSIIGNSAVGFTVPVFHIHYRVPLGSSFAYAVLDYVLTLVGVYVFALILDALAPTFGGIKDRTQALKLSAYSMTPAWLIAVVSLYPPLGIVRMIGLYGLFLLYLGLPPLMKSPREKSLGYTVAAIAAAVVIYLVIGAIAGLAISRPDLAGLKP